jgi:hypothetical protein
MKASGLLAMAFTLTACVSSQTPRPDAGAVAAQDPPAYGPETLAATAVQVDLMAQPNAETVDCRKTAPTGTRIAVQRCEVTTQSSADQMGREQMLRDIDEIRRRQFQREAVRQNAARAASAGAVAPAP